MFGKIKFGETPFSLKKLRENSNCKDGDSSGWSSQVSLRTSRKTLSEVTATASDTSEVAVPKTALSTVPDEEQSEVLIGASGHVPNARPTTASQSYHVRNERPIIASMSYPMPNKRPTKTLELDRVPNASSTTAPKSDPVSIETATIASELDHVPNARPTIAPVLELESSTRSTVASKSDLLSNKEPTIASKSDLVSNGRPTVPSEEVAVAVQGDAFGATSDKHQDEILDTISGDDTSGESSGMQEIFRLIDPDGEGYITLDKLRRTSQQLGLGFTEEEMEGMIQEADPSGKGQVNYNEINTLFVETQVATDAEQKLMADIDDAFDLFDTGQDGRLRTTKLAHALRIANMYPTDKDVRKILRKLGYPIKISYRQFKKIAIEVSRTDNERLVAAFQCFDKDNSGYLSEQKLRQILRPALCKDFTRKDLEQLISDFSADGKVDLEVFVAYMTGQEQYLSTAKRPNLHNTALQLPSISEESSASSRSRKNALNKLN